jgi:hypothetical protein
MSTQNHAYLAANQRSASEVDAEAIGQVGESFSPERAGLSVIRCLQETKGGAWTSNETPISTVTLDRMRSEFQVVYWQIADGSYRYPVWQFDRTGAIASGIADVLRIFTSQDQWRVMRYFLGAREEFRGKRPLDLLREGEIDRVVDHAHRHAEENTW